MFDNDLPDLERASQRAKTVTFMMNGRPNKTFTIQIFKKPLTKQQIQRTAQKYWAEPTSSIYINYQSQDESSRGDLVKSMGLPETKRQFESSIFSAKTLRIFSIEAVEYFDEDLQYLKNGDRLYLSNGEDFDSNKNFGEYQIVAKLGEGGFGSVDLARNVVTQEFAAIKVLKPGKNTSGSDIDMIFKQAENLKALSHPNIVKILNCYTLNDMRVVIVMEYLEGGELLQLLKKQKNESFEQKQAKGYFKQIVNGVAYCHKKGIVHRDLKLQNILIKNVSSLDGSQGSIKDERILKIADFGISGVADQFNPEVDWGTLRYMSPQVLSGKTKLNSPAVDVWACGVILFLLVTGKHPFNGSSSSSIIQSIVKKPLEFPSDILLTIKCKNLIKKLLQKDPSKRISITEIEDHPWISSNLTAITLPQEMSLILKDHIKTESDDLNNLSIDWAQGSYNGNLLTQYDIEDLKKINKLNKPRNNINKNLSLKERDGKEQRIGIHGRKSINMQFGIGNSPHGVLSRIPKRLQKEKNQIIEQLRFYKDQRNKEMIKDKQKDGNKERVGSRQRDRMLSRKQISSLNVELKMLPKISNHRYKYTVNVNDHCQQKKEKEKGIQAVLNRNSYYSLNKEQ